MQKYKYVFVLVSPFNLRGRERGGRIKLELQAKKETCERKHWTNKGHKNRELNCLLYLHLACE